MRDYEAMTAAIAARGTVPFDWKANDCARFAAAVVEAQTGKRPLKGLRWRTAAGAKRVIERLGGMEAALDARLTPVPPSMAKRGDVAGVPDDELGLRLMIVEGATLVGPGPKGARREPRSAMTHAWSAE